MADHDDARTARFLLVLAERASERRRHAHCGEEAGGDASHVHRACLAAVVPTRYARIRERNGGVTVLDATDQVVVGIGFVVMVAAAPAIQVTSRHDGEEAVCLWHTDARKEESLERRKDDGIGAERERHREHGDGESGLAAGHESEPGFARERTKSVDHGTRWMGADRYKRRTVAALLMNARKTVEWDNGRDQAPVSPRQRYRGPTVRDGSDRAYWCDIVIALRCRLTTALAPPSGARGGDSCGEARGPR